jgi:hypothetical protein
MSDFDERTLALHPWVREAIYEGNRDRPLSLNWLPAEPEAYDCLGLPKLSRNAMVARNQIIAEALAAGPDRFVSYSRRAGFYNQGRYYPPTFSYRAILPAVDQLAGEGLLDHQKMPPGHRGYQSRFRASELLLKELEDTRVIYEPLEIIILRDADKCSLEYRDNRDTRQMRDRLELINEALGSQNIAVAGRVIREGDRLDNGGRARVQLHRVFNRGDFGFGGRFYGGHWQNIGDRHRISINGQQTKEVDYPGLHIRLLYQEAGKIMPADPYEIAGWPREQIKLAMLIAINARTHTSAVRALSDALRHFPGVSDRFKTADKLIRAAKAKHPDIAHAFGSDAGARLMRKDSELAERIMLEMLRVTGIVPLCVHDSFIVPVNEAGMLWETMERALSCGNTSLKPTPKSAKNRDNLSDSNQTTNPRTVSTIWEEMVDRWVGDEWEMGYLDLPGSPRNWRIACSSYETRSKAA